MDIKLLRAFVTLAHEGTYHSAASVLCITQPALSKQIQTLEHLSGVTLFQRGRHGARLTVAGEQLLAAASEVVERYADFFADVAAIQKGDSGKLTLGFGISSFLLAPKYVAAFRVRYPGVQVSLNDMPSAVQTQLLAEGRLQVGFVRLPVPEPLQSQSLDTEQLVLAVAAEGFSSSLETTQIIENQQLLQLAPQRGEGLTAQADQFLSARKLTPRTVSAADDIQTLLALVAAGDGVALLPASVKHILPAGVRLLPLEGEHTQWQTGLAWNAGIKDPLRDKFLAMVMDDGQMS